MRPAGRPAGRRLGAIVGVAVVAIVAAHGALWWWVTGQLELHVAAAIAAPPMPGWQASGAVVRRGGWPLAATVEVPGLVLIAALAPGEVLRWQAGRLVVAIELFHPRTLVLALDGPQLMQLGGAPAVPVRAAVMRARAPLGPGAAGRAATIEIADLVVGEAQERFTLDRLDIATEAHSTAQQGEPAVSVVATARQMTLPPVRIWPLGPVVDRAVLDLVVTGPAPRSPDLAERAEAWRDGGGTLELRRLELTWGEVTLSGGATLALDAQLQPMGVASAQVAGYGAALRALTVSGVLTPRSAMAAGAVLSLIARTPAGGGTPVVEVPLSLQNRTLSLGRIPLVRLPELVWRPSS